MQDMIKLAIEVTTQGDPRLSPYRVASWLSAQGYYVFMPEIREALGMIPDEIGPEIVGGIKTMIRDEQAREA